jgi:hypothetical protein
MSEAIELVVVENGARWPAWASRGHITASDRIVVVSDAAGDAMGLVLRTLDRLARVEADGSWIQSVIVIVGGDLGQAAIEARRTLARVLLSHMTRVPDGQLVFAVSGVAAPAESLELMSLAGTLTGEIKGTLSVSVRFGDERLSGEELPSCIRVVADDDTAVA